uniref:F-box protein n=1 Tax=Oryza meridionalis TaxID=40149 RepID=A0A0E0C8W5_9ORYZ
MSEPLHEARRGMREPTTPPWGALPIVVPFLDPKSLAAASCVCTSWSAAFGADGLWVQLCHSYFPSALGLLHLLDDGGAEARGPHSSPHRRLFGLFHAASHGQQVKPPRLALDDVSFAVDIIGASGNAILSFAVAARDAGPKNSVFQFGVDTSDRNAALLPGERWSVRLTAVRAGPGLAPTAFVMVYAENKEMPAPPTIGIRLRGVLPIPGCSARGTSILVAEVEITVSIEERFVREVNFWVMQPDYRPSSAAPTFRPRSGSFTCSMPTAAPTPEDPITPLVPSPHTATSPGHRALQPPGLALDDVSFAIDIEADGNNVLSFAVTPRDAGPKNSVFQFGVDTGDMNAAVGRAERWSVRLTAVRARAEPGFAPAAFMMIDPVPEELEIPKADEIGMGVCLYAELPAPGGCDDWGDAIPDSGGPDGDQGDRRDEVEINFGVTLLTSDSDSDGRLIDMLACAAVEADGSVSRARKRPRIGVSAEPARPSAPMLEPEPPWLVLRLVGPFLDAESLAAASCVSTACREAFTAEDLWSKLLRSQYPSALGLLPLQGNGADASGRSSSPYRRLFTLFRSASARRRALPPPRLALDDVTFAIDIFAASGENTLSFVVAARDAIAKTGRFQFEVDLTGRNAAVGPGEFWSVRWTALRAGLIGFAPLAVEMMDAKAPAARARALFGGATGETWATGPLPAPGCGGATVEAEVVFEVSGEERLLEKVRFGVMAQCRYVSIDDGLRCLQHFLL